MSRRRPVSYVLPVADATSPVSTGEGITRTSSNRARLFLVRVYFEHAKPLTDSIKAVSATQAQAFARNRYPTQVSIELL
jgi:hypothetical protein